MNRTVWQYECKRCGYQREGLLDHEDGIGGYSWSCPRCPDGGRVHSYDVTKNMKAIYDACTKGSYDDVE